MKKIFYSLANILKEDADYNVIYGERSNGKTFSFKHLVLFGFHENGININGYLDDSTQSAIIRRFDEDFRKGRGASMWNDIIDNPTHGNMLEKATNGKWNFIKYYSGAFYLAKIEDGKLELTDSEPFCYAFSLNSAEHYKSNSYPKIVYILLDEFIATANGYLMGEFMLFTSVLSTIIRDRGNVKIFMMGNTINRINPYFKEMGINAKDQQQDTIQVYSYGESTLKVAVEYTGSAKDKYNNRLKKKSDKYFAFNNPKLKMITTGAWELDIYPHLPYKYKPKDILYTYYIEYEGEIFQCEIIDVDNKMNPFTYIHKKTTPIKDDGYSIIYSQKYSTLPNHKRKLIYALSNIEKKITWFFKNDRVFYQDNDIGNMIDNYIAWCENSK